MASSLTRRNKRILGPVVFLVLYQLFTAINAETPCGVTDAQVQNPCFSTKNIELVLDPLDCESYYQCIDEIGFRMPCPKGFHFNNKEKSCEIPAKAGCIVNTFGSTELDCPPASCGDIPHGGLSPDPTDCRFYFICDRGQSVKRPCPNGLYYNAKKEWCDWPEESGCDFNGNSTSKPPVVTNTPGVTESPEVTGKPTEAPAKCGDIPHGGLSPDPTDCRFYYICDRGENVRRPCPNGLYYNAQKQWCDWPEESGCTINGNSTTKPPVVTNTPGVTEGPGVTSVPTEPPAKCGDIPHGGLSPDPTDCRFFYICNYGENVRKVCPDGLYYNAEKQWCDWPEESGCDNGNSTTKPPIVTNPPSTTENPEVTGKPTEAPPKCGDIPHGGLSPDPTDCRFYYICDRGQNIRRPCPDGLYYNAEKQWCDWPAESGCVNGNSTTKPPIVTNPPGTTENPEVTGKPTEVPPKCGDIPHGGLSPDPTDCRFYYICDRGQNIKRPCPDGLYYNAEKQWCDWPEESGCTMNGNSTSKPPVITNTPGVTEEPGVTSGPTAPPTKCGDIAHGDLTPDTTDCRFYFICDSGVQVRMPCPNGLYFNAKKKWCDWPEESGCEFNGNSTSKPPVITEAPGSTASPGTTQGPEGTEIPLKCGDQNHGELSADPESCEHFYQCSFGKNVKIPCPKGLHFNAKSKVCDWPLSAGCDSSIIPPGGGCRNGKSCT